MCVDLAILRLVMEVGASGASGPEESWFSEHHQDREITAQRISQPHNLLYYMANEKCMVPSSQ